MDAGRGEYAGRKVHDPRPPFLLALALPTENML